MNETDCHTKLLGPNVLLPDQTLDKSLSCLLEVGAKGSPSPWSVPALSPFLLWHSFYFRAQMCSKRFAQPGSAMESKLDQCNRINFLGGESFLRKVIYLL
jgi:hypothetical protein